MSIQSMYNRHDELRAKIEEMAGRKGVGALREELETLRSRLVDLTVRRRSMKAKINSQNADGRSADHVAMMRRALSNLTNCKISRGMYEELFFSRGVGATTATSLLESILQRAQTHPNARPFAGWLRANATLVAAIRDGLIPGTDADFDKKGRGWAINHDLYGYAGDGTLILVQVRRAEVTKYGTNVKISYFVTDGDDAVEIEWAKGNIKKAAQADPAPDSPLRYLRSQLKDEWRTKIDEKPVKFAAPKAAQAKEVFKILHDDGGTLRSVYSGEEYALGKRKMQKAQSGHGGGYYAFATQESAERVFRQGRAFGEGLMKGKNFVICRGRAWGTPVCYSNSKMAYSIMVIDEVIGPVAV